MNRTFTLRTFPLIIVFCIAFMAPVRIWAAIPKAPSTLVAMAASGSQINLTWLDLAKDETGFEVEQSADGTKFAKIADLPANTVIYQDKSLKPNTKYWYRVRAKNASGASAWSSLANATTFQVPPDAPSNLTATAVSTSQIDLKWADNADNESGYQVERSQNGTTFTKIADLAANITTYKNTTLAAATEYFYRVRAVNAAGASAYSNTGSAKTQNIPVPDAPTKLTAVPTAPDLIQLRWAKPTANAAEIVIERAKGDGSFAQIAKVAASVLQYEDKSELETADYLYRIKAVNAGGSSPYSLIAIVRAASIITGVESPNDQHSIYMAGTTLVVALNSTAEAKLSVYDMAGRLCNVKKIRREGRVDLSSLPNGVYVVVTDTGNEVISKRILLY
ncbi:Por secretion system C-terminal sorting domain-containing protein [Dyadobacter soli]|uniref:Por secretion system C-terminal sorting domain-containing protein n=1 Tax=Dyadobacter soli TaxID=659014 RepID=A0A1G6XDG5_9BACT|nr:fibronectin type III domain-containing protein [Dyadobacter soli]SDD76259.1 Por secretion system C-terminal sorting domain-containing protein [Dyadobacter soli]